MNKITLRFIELIMVAKMLLAYVAALFYKKRNIWVICERGREARDNGYFFFKWLKKNKPELQVYYILDKQHADYYKLKDYEDCLIQYKSVNHFVMLYRASHLISTHVMGFTENPSFFKKLDNIINVFPGKKRIFLQHGITKDDIPGLYADKNKLNLFVCGGKLEHEYICNHYGYSPKVAQYTGFCRYDNLSIGCANKQVLIMPTWRMYIDKNKFEESNYFNVYKELLTSQHLEQMLKKYGYNAVFYPHFEVQSHIHLFKDLLLSPLIKIAGFESDVQTLLIDSACLVTDYSSVYFDMNYMKKPVLFYQFDSSIFHGKHYKKGYIVESDLGIVCDNLKDLLDNLELTLRSNCVQIDKYAEFSNHMFVHRDINNCKRVFDAINNI